MSTWVDNYLEDLGAADADITSHDAYTSGVPHATFERLRRGDPVHWTEEADGSGFWSIFRYDDALACLLYTSPSPRDATLSRMPSSA